MMLDTDQLKGNGSIIEPTIHFRKANKKGHRTILARFLNEPLYRDSQIKSEWDENTCIAHDEIAKR